MKAKIFVASFSDIFGVSHPAAQCMISFVSRNESAHFGADGAESKSSQVSYQVRHWHSEGAINSGALPQEFINSDRLNTFYFNDGEGNGMEALIEKCQQDFIQNVLPKQA